MAKLNREDRVTITNSIRKGCPSRHSARLISVSDGPVRYHCRRRTEGAVDGRSRRSALAFGYREAFDAYLEGRR